MSIDHMLYHNKQSPILLTDLSSVPAGQPILKIFAYSLHASTEAQSSIIITFDNAHPIIYDEKNRVGMKMLM